MTHPYGPTITQTITETIIERMMAVATDSEADTIRDVLVRCNIFWRCSSCSCTFTQDVTSCEQCGERKTE